ncbi:MAG: N-acetylglucosamine-6-phosphate deacetylase [Leptolyngbyaceae cyanobacterium SM1_1_3]|nr:N-acetylglucosamine-6-phosphate deacetylase [Leptolyngbyaceae cyanobacterium SM1_1_3]NJN04692.1 N-acetylglucosamine-6-phosphate deacetylase [Leptolyngbyaceae cyanobacterium RM1_1_2]NJO11449.1 N-acetylglucosamine-6-phosphate deacetylase [Leptolyngbyaceae cyanobacterium SL_1_1]
MVKSAEIINVWVAGRAGLQRVWIEQGQIEAIAPMSTPVSASALRAVAGAEQIDLAGDWLSLGGVDLQINGALGLAFPDLGPGDEQKLQKICDFLWQQGIDGFLPTLVTTAVEKFQQALAVLGLFRPARAETAQVLGAHLEGPCLNPSKRGAHPEGFLLPLELSQLQRVLGDFGDRVRVVTLAPELDVTGDVIPYLRSLGITVSLGHSLATAAQAQKAFAQGATMVTHAFNAMPGLHHREPGLLGAAIAHPNVFCGLIADGEHICPTMLDLLLRASRGSQRCQLEGLFLVSDALSPLGLPDGIYPWDSRQIEVKQGTARLPDGTLSGTTLPLLEGARNLVRWGLCSVEEAIALATEAPRQAIGLPGLGTGQPATLLRWHWNEGTNCLNWQRLNIN